MNLGHYVFVGSVIMFFYCGSCHREIAVTDLIETIQKQCLSEFSTKCVKSRTLDWIKLAMDNDVVTITDNLSILKTGEQKLPRTLPRGNLPGIVKFLYAIDDYTSTHSFRVKQHADFDRNEARSFNESPEKDLIVPLNSKSFLEGRGFVRKAMIPFLLGLKLQTSILVPLALALIALKTWKAMTFALLSLVLSGAIVVFKLIKQNVINYEVVQPPIIEHPIAHHPDHHADHLAYRNHYHHHDFADNEIVDHADHHIADHVDLERIQTYTEQPSTSWQGL